LVLRGRSFVATDQWKDSIWHHSRHCRRGNGTILQSFVNNQERPWCCIL